MLNEKQAAALQIASDGHNLLLLGAAGTGKSFLIKQIAEKLTAKGKQVALTCTTGISCSVYTNAMTIHKWSGIGDGRYDIKDILELVKHNVAFQQVRKRVATTDVLIIDECSMLSARFFSSLVEVFRYRNPDSILGGIQIILAGDFMQLPPVPNAAYSEDGDFCFKHPNFSSCFPHRVTLTEVVRQSELQFIQAISETASGEVSDATINFIEGLSKSPGSSNIKLFPRNDQVDDFNRKSIVEKSGELYEFRARDDGDRSKLDRMLAPKVLWLKEDAPVILLRNLSDKLVNGLQGRVVRVSEQGPVVEFASVGLTVSLDRFKFSVFSPTMNRDVATRVQFPIKLAFAITIHKAQGLTMDSVEIDCRGVFKPGQLGVALGRARSSAGLCVINFSRQCILRQPEQIRQFMQQPTRDLQDDFRCCKEQLNSTVQTEVQEGIFTVEEMKCIQDIETAEGFELSEEEEFDEDFDKAILAILDNETADVQLPDDLDLDKLLDSIRCKDVITPAQFNTNKIIGEIDSRKYRTFCQKEFAQMSSFLTKLLPKLDAAQPIPISEQSEFYSKVHQYQISVEFRMNCLYLFDTTFSEDHLHVCYNISVALRQYLLAKKAAAYPVSNRSSGQRQVTHDSHARIRYIAGYCVAKVRHKCCRQKQAYMYDTSVSGQCTYKQALCAVSILDSLKMQEQFVAETTTMPYSLIDIERRQNINRSLASVSDALFKFFMKLTEKGITLLVDKNLNEQRSDMFQFLLDAVLSCETLFNEFVNVIDVSEVGMSGLDVTSVEAELKSDQVNKIYRKFVKLFLMVMVNQFRKDLLDSFDISKKMAHRKQIRVAAGTKSQKGQGKQSLKQVSSSQKSGKSGGKRPKSVESNTSNEESDSTSRKKLRVDHRGDAPSFEAAPELEVTQAEVINSPKQIADTAASECSDEEDHVVCSVCKTREADIDWLQCDGCLDWSHRLCVGLKHHMKWKKATKKGAKFYCKACE